MSVWVEKTVQGILMRRRRGRKSAWVPYCGKCHGEDCPWCYPDRNARRKPKKEKRELDFSGGGRPG